ncbi:CPBP family intramembrane metalloprotease [Paenibacillus sp. 1011MAR3C5]|uniref:CPBP family intramembrane glutamic endopeptidase n=1 Tax=Paenibacillus sp. 1011MAR3C5 TaxID=1675787 RepID=UPI000E6C3113|nr:CPBP family intramembrane glutamic endopeptidase [Paenibacillus sp. 1011MAR3C5]RJE86237.1 CPBP family intramembrane metalloprotease [Paenibacillus sp. 1011MAR3C5]
MKRYKEQHVWLDLIGYAFLIGGSLILSTLGVAIVQNLLQEDFSWSDLDTNAATIAGVLLALLLLAVVTRQEKKRSLWEFCGFRTIRMRRIGLFIGLGMLLSIAFGLILQLDVWGQLAVSHEQKAADEMASGPILLVWVTAGILTPFIEEIMLRGLVLRTLRHVYSLTTAVIVQAILSALLHTHPLQVSYTFLLGLLFAWAAIRMKSLWASVILHISFHSTTILIIRAIREYESAGLFVGSLIVAILLICIGLLPRGKSPQGRTPYFSGK